MRDQLPCFRSFRLMALGLFASLFLGEMAHAGKVSWLDDVVRQAVRETEAGGKSMAKSEARSAGRFFAKEAEESLEGLARRSDDLSRAARKLEEPAEVALKSRFARLTRAEPQMARTFDALAPVEKRLVVEMGETAQILARRYPGQADTMIRKLGVEGMSAVRAYGDDVAEVLAKEGPEGVNVLRKTGRNGWKFYVDTVLANKKKLAAAGVVAAFLANPDKFVDTAGRVTEYAVTEFAKAGVKLAGAVSEGAARGLETVIGGTLANYGLDSAVARKVGMGLAGMVAVLATMVLLGFPVKWIFRPLTWPLRVIRGKMRAV